MELLVLTGQQLGTHAPGLNRSRGQPTPLSAFLPEQPVAGLRDIVFLRPKFASSPPLYAVSMFSTTLLSREWHYAVTTSSRTPSDCDVEGGITYKNMMRSPRPPDSKVVNIER